MTGSFMPLARALVAMTLVVATATVMLATASRSKAADWPIAGTQPCAKADLAR